MEHKAEAVKRTIYWSQARPGKLIASFVFAFLTIGFFVPVFLGLFGVEISEGVLNALLWIFVPIVFVMIVAVGLTIDPAQEKCEKCGAKFKSGFSTCRKCGHEYVKA